MSVLRVLHVVTSLEAGGMENGICNLAHALAPRGISTLVACLETRGAFADRLPVAAAVTVLGKSRGSSPRAVVQLWRTIRWQRPHVVHTHNLGPLIYGALATLGGRTAPLLHGEHSQLAPWEMTERRLRQRRRFYRACRAIHTVSDAQREELIGLGFPAEKIVAISNGVDTARFQPGDRTAARNALGLPPDAQVLGLVGRFGPHKGHATLLAAFAAVAASHPSAHFVFLGGGGPEESAISEAVAVHPFRERIHAAGFRADLERCYPALDLLVSPSTNEGMSNVALEAMACAVPVLANTGCGNEAFLRDGTNGWLDDLRTPHRLAVRVRELLADPARLTAAGKKARETVESRFALTNMVATYEALYRRVAG